MSELDQLEKANRLIFGRHVSVAQQTLRIHRSFTKHTITTIGDQSKLDVFAIDLDGDGDVDVLSADFDDPAVYWYENDGSQSFTDEIIATNVYGAWAVFATDVDGDGDVDAMVAANTADTIAWYENDGTQSVTGVVARFFLHHSGSTGHSRSTS